MSVGSELRRRLDRLTSRERESDPTPTTGAASMSATGAVDTAVLDDPGTEPSPAPDDAFALTDHQVAFFEQFGFLRVRGLFAADIDGMIEGFEEVFADNPRWETREPLHFDEQRLIIPGFIAKSDKLAWLQHDERVVSIVESLVGPTYEWAESDGNLFSCDTSWHPDNYNSPLEQVHVKLSFYLDPLSGANGAIRMIPGTNHWLDPYARGLRRDLNDPEAIRGIFGVDPADIPSWTLENEPGDVIIWSFRTIHASFNGGQRRRLFSLNFREPAAA